MRDLWPRPHTAAREWLQARLLLLLHCGELGGLQGLRWGTVSLPDLVWLEAWLDPEYHSAAVASAVATGPYEGSQFATWQVFTTLQCSFEWVKM